MSKVIQTGIIIQKETVYDKIRRSLFMLIYQKDFLMMQKLDELLKPKRPSVDKIIIPKEIGKNIVKYQ